MKNIWLILVGGFLLGVVLLYGSGVTSRNSLEFSKYITLEEQLVYTDELVASRNFGHYESRSEVEKIEAKIINSTEYMINRFRKDLEKTPTLHVQVLQDLAFWYWGRKQEYDKGEKYISRYEKLLENNKEAFSKEEYDKLVLRVFQDKSSIYFDQGKYDRVVDVNLKKIEKFPYSIAKDTGNNLWIDAYTSIWHMYNDRIKNYDKALYYAKAMAIDPRKLPKEKIGWLGNYEVSYEQKLSNDAEINKGKSDYAVQITYGSFKKYKEIQQYLVDSNKSYEVKNGCAYYNGMEAVEDLYKQYEKYGVLVTFDINNIFIFYPDKNSFGCALKIGDKKYKYTEVTSREIFPEELEFLNDGNIKILTESVLVKINEQNRKIERPEISEQELTKGWKRETRIIDEKELKRLFKRVH